MDLMFYYLHQQVLRVLQVVRFGCLAGLKQSTVVKTRYS